MTTSARRYSVAAAAVLLAILLTPANIFSCGPFFQEPVFTDPTAPDQPLELFAKGRLGIVLPQYETQYLVVAYRYLAGPKLSSADEQALIEAWKPKVIPAGEPWPEQVPVDEWLKARSSALGDNQVAKVNIDRYRFGAGPFELYPSCGDDAFLTAAATAGNLVKQFGAKSEAVRDWVDAQDTVFKNCGDTSGFAVNANSARELHASIPKPPKMQNAVLRMDRDYQIAAANFYAGDWQTAAQHFQQIADNRESPWRIWAPYLVARCYIREATLSNSGESSANTPGADSSFNVQDMTAAEKQLQSILKNPALNTVHPAAQRLLNYVDARLHPDERLHEVAQQLEGKAPTSDFQQDLIDFRWLLRHQKPPGIDAAESADELAQRGLLDDLTDWVMTFSNPTADSLTHSVERWRATKSEAWLMAALTQARAKDASASALIDAAAAVAPSSPAYEMAVFHRTRLLMEQGLRDAARQLLDANLKRFESGPLSSLNLLLAQRFALATDYHQFLEFAPRTPGGLAWDTGGDLEPDDRGKPEAGPLPKRFDVDSVGTINQRLPLTMLTQAATGDVLPGDLRSLLATATWTRAAILNDAPTAKALESLAVAAHPELRDYVSAYENANSEDARTIAATWTMLHFPGMRPFVEAGALRQAKFTAIDDFRDNWWCDNVGASASNAEAMFSSSWTESAQPKPAAPPSPSFLTEAERTRAEQQWRDLSTIGAAPIYFGRIVFQWAKESPKDGRVPEALYLLVRSTRYGCTTDQTGSVSKQAFDLLHTRYPDSPWTKKTPYWFK